MFAATHATNPATSVLIVLLAVKLISQPNSDIVLHIWRRSHKVGYFSTHAPAPTVPIMPPSSATSGLAQTERILWFTPMAAHSLSIKLEHSTYSGSTYTTTPS